MRLPRETTSIALVAWGLLGGVGLLTTVATSQFASEFALGSGKHGVREVLKAYFDLGTDTPVKCVLVNELFRLFLLGLAIPLVHFSPSRGGSRPLRILSMCGWLAQFLVGACSQVPILLGLVASSSSQYEETDKSGRIVIQRYDARLVAVLFGFLLTSMFALETYNAKKQADDGGDALLVFLIFPCALLSAIVEILIRVASRWGEPTTTPAATDSPRDRWNSPLATVVLTVCTTLIMAYSVADDVRRLYEGCEESRVAMGGPRRLGSSPDEGFTTSSLLSPSSSLISRLATLRHASSAVHGALLPTSSLELGRRWEELTRDGPSRGMSFEMVILVPAFAIWTVSRLAARGRSYAAWCLAPLTLALLGFPSLTVAIWGFI